ncbi:MAG: RluA family pseudouridine synthase [Treponema sp.]|nr:RluA family pseudouridine synthase [Treponema sp.]
MKTIEIVYEDDSCLVINKPAGLAVQGGVGVKVSLDKILAEIRTPPPLLVHRLDKDTSGLILVAKNREAAADFSRLLSDGRASGGIFKQYTAVCLGCPAGEHGSIKADLEIRGSAKKSETIYKLIKTGALTITDECSFSVLELTLGTGRMHQIRRHLAMTGNPILGDDKYGDFSLNKKLRKTIGLKRLMLHAHRLVVDVQGLTLNLYAPLPDYYALFTEASLSL